MFSGLEKQIITEIDLKQVISAQQLGQILCSSDKTIYRKVKAINQVFISEYDMQLIKTVSGQGYMINEQVSKLELSRLLNVDVLDIDIVDLIGVKLVSCSPKTITIVKLFANYYLSESSIKRRIHQLESRLQVCDLRLVKSGKELKVVGNEIDIRKYLQIVYTTTINKNSYFSIDSNQLELNKYNKQIKQIISMIENQLTTEIIEPYYTNMYVYMAIILNRYYLGIVDFEQSNQYLTGVKTDDLVINSLAISTYQKLGQITNRKLKLEEITNIYILILSTRMTNVQLSNNNQVIKHITNDYISSFIKQSNCPYSPTDELYYNLRQHIGPMIFRNENDVKIINHLTAEVKITYKSDYLLLAKITKQIENKYNLHQIGDDEIAYLTLYFEEFLLKKTSKLRVIVTCASGIGTSKLLKIKLENTTNELDIVCSVSNNQVIEAIEKYRNIDLIIATSSLESYQLEVPIVYVNPLLSQDDLANLKAVIEEVKNG